MSNYYNVIRGLGKGQGLFPTMQQQATAPALEEEVCGTFAEACFTSSTPLETGDATQTPPFTSSFDPGRQGENPETHGGNEELRNSGFFGAIATALRAILKRARSSLIVSIISTPHDAEIIESMAHEEQIKLIQRVFLNVRPPKVFVFVGIEEGSGCTSVCAEAAKLLVAQVSGSVCLVDANLRNPGVHRAFGMSNTESLADVFDQPRSIQDCAQPVSGHERLSIITAGEYSSHVHGLLNLGSPSDCLNELRKTFDFVIVDGPTVREFGDASRLGALADGIVLVIAANSTRRHVVKKAQYDLKAANCNLLAAVLNRRTYPVPDAIYRHV